jgi:hypothetical protein
LQLHHTLIFLQVAVELSETLREPTAIELRQTGVRAVLESFVDIHSNAVAGA